MNEPRKYIARQLISFFAVVAVALVGFNISSQSASADTLAGQLNPLRNYMTLGLWFLVLVELTVWPIVFYRDLQKIKKDAARAQLLSGFWLLTGFVTTLITMALSR